MLVVVVHDFVRRIQGSVDRGGRVDCVHHESWRRLGFFVAFFPEDKDNTNQVLGMGYRNIIDLTNGQVATLLGRSLVR